MIPRADIPNLVLPVAAVEAPTLIVPDGTTKPPLLTAIRL